MERECGRQVTRQVLALREQHSPAEAAGVLGKRPEKRAWRRGRGREELAARKTQRGPEKREAASRAGRDWRLATAWI